ncbi:MAG: Gfo/Idh/MocA family oxidoreductase [Planctomycetota bacterium]
MANEPLRLGLVSCGEIALKHQKAIDGVDEAEVVACMDIHEPVARDMAERCDCPCFTDLGALVAEDAVEAVLISTPHYLHAPQTIQAARAGKHVMVEKPIATTEEDATAMIRECRQAGVRLKTIFPQRYQRSVVKARELIRAGVIGDVRLLTLFSIGHKEDSYWRGGFTGRVTTDWRRSKEKAGGGFLIMNFVHNIDCMRFVTGLEAETVYADYDTFATPVEVEDAIVATVRYENGALGAIVGTTFAAGGGVRSDVIIGTRGQIEMGNPLRVYLSEPAEGMAANEWLELPCERIDARGESVREFAEAVRAGRDPDITGEDGRSALRVCLAAYEAGAAKAPVRVPA